MPRKTRTDTRICANFCTYYKPGRNEELACQGYVVVQRLVTAGKALSQDRPDRLSAPDEQTRKTLEERVCRQCSFREEDCDYIATGGNAPSCGGLKLLSHLLGKGELKPEDIE